MSAETIKQRIIQRRQAQRNIQRTKAGLLNLHKINDRIDQIILDLGLESQPTNDIGVAIEHLKKAAELITAHGDQLLNEPMKRVNAVRGQYDAYYEQGSEFDSPQDIMQRQADERRAESDAVDNARIEAETDANYHAATGDTLERDENGQFAAIQTKTVVASNTKRGYNLGKRTVWSGR